METVMTVISLGVSFVSFVLSLITFVTTVQRDRKRATLDSFNRLQTEVFDQLNKYTPKEIRAIAQNNKSEEYKIVSSYVARIEHFCVGVNKKIYDKKVVYDLAHGFLDGASIRNRIDPIIDQKQRRADEDYYGNTRKILEWMDQEHKRREKRKKNK